MKKSRKSAQKSCANPARNVEHVVLREREIMPYLLLRCCYYYIPPLLQDKAL